ncbi:unnamed protein product [Schistosoma turkestanicum]|nr:unnamed protein product [Schistosoma turkestanicum]
MSNGEDSWNNEFESKDDNNNGMQEELLELRNVFTQSNAKHVAMPEHLPTQPAAAAAVCGFTNASGNHGISNEKAQIFNGQNNYESNSEVYQRVMNGKARKLSNCEPVLDGDSENTSKSVYQNTQINGSSLGSNKENGTDYQDTESSSQSQLTEKLLNKDPSIHHTEMYGPHKYDNSVQKVNSEFSENDSPLEDHHTCTAKINHGSNSDRKDMQDMTENDVEVDWKSELTQTQTIRQIVKEEMNVNQSGNRISLKNLIHNLTDNKTSGTDYHDAETSLQHNELTSKLQNKEPTIHPNSKSNDNELTRQNYNNTLMTMNINHASYSNGKYIQDLTESVVEEICKSDLPLLQTLQQIDKTEMKIKQYYGDQISSKKIPNYKLIDNNNNEMNYHNAQTSLLQPDELPGELHNNESSIHQNEIICEPNKIDHDDSIRKIDLLVVESNENESTHHHQHKMYTLSTKINHETNSDGSKSKQDLTIEEENKIDQVEAQAEENQEWKSDLPLLQTLQQIDKAEVNFKQYENHISSQINSLQNIIYYLIDTSNNEIDYNNEMKTSLQNELIEKLQQHNNDSTIHYNELCRPYHQYDDNTIQKFDYLRSGENEFINENNHYYSAINTNTTTSNTTNNKINHENYISSSKLNTSQNLINKLICVRMNNGKSKEKKLRDDLTGFKKMNHNNKKQRVIYEPLPLGEEILFSSNNNTANGKMHHHYSYRRNNKRTNRNMILPSEKQFCTIL